MKVYLFLWIFVCGTILLELCASSSESTSTDSSLSNLVIDSFTEANFDNLQITSLQNFSDASAMDSEVNTGTSQSSPANEKCNSTDCIKNVSTSSSSESLSSASKILWNLVSTSKSTVQPSVNEENNLSEESTVSSPYSPITAHSSDHSSIHGTSFYSSDNELDSEINYDEVQLVHSNNKLSDSFLVESDNITTSSTESGTSTEIVDELDKLQNNITFSTVTEMQTDLYNASNTSNVTTAFPTNQEATGYTDDELDFTTYFINLSNSSDESIVTQPNDEIKANFYADHFTTEIPFIESDASEFNESGSFFSLDNNATSESIEPKSKSVTVIPSTLDLLKSYSTNTERVEDNTDNSTEMYLESDSTFETEKLKPKNLEMNDEESVPTTHISFESSVNFDTNVELLNETFTDINSVSTESSTTDFQTNMLTDSVKQNSSFESREMQNNGDEKIMNQSMAADKTSLEESSFNNSNESTEGIDYLFNFNKDINHTNTALEHTTMVKDFSEKSVGELFSQSTTVASANTIDFEPSVSVSDIEGISSEVLDLDNSTKGSFNKVNSSDLFDYNTLTQNTTLNSIPEFENAEERQFTSEQNSNIEHLSTINDTSYGFLNDSDNFNEIHHDLPLEKTNLNNTSLDSKFLEMSSEISVTLNSSLITSYTETSIGEGTSKQILTDYTEIQENNSHIIEVKKDHTEDKVPTDEVHLENVTEVFGQTPQVSVVSSETDPEYKFSTTEGADKSMNNTDYLMPGLSSEKTDTKTADDLGVASSVIESSVTPTDYTMPGLYSEKTDTKTANDLGIVSSVIESSVTPTYSSIRVVTEAMSDSKTTQTGKTEYTEKIIHSKDTEYTIREEESVSARIDTIESISKTFSENDVVTDSNYLVTESVSTSHDIEIETASEISSSYTETHREGKHIPFSSTLGHKTTQYPRIFNVTTRTYSHPPQSETTRNNFDDLLYSQIRAEELSPEERSNLVNAVVKFPDTHYSKEELNERIAVIHLWLLHVVADEYKNATLNLSGTNPDRLNDIEFENLPQILYIFPTPEVFPPNITFTFVVHNKWRNETFPVDIILTILNLHSESLKKVLEDIEDIHFSHGLLLQKHDFLSVIIEKYGIILLSTCLITVGMILILICIVVYYRRKTRHSAHCLTDDKLHRNMQEAMGIDLNPAVIILQDEIREKAALNGNKICSLDDDEGWLAPIGDVPVEDNNAPYVQDTKL